MEKWILSRANLSKLLVEFATEALPRGIAISSNLRLEFVHGSTVIFEIPQTEEIIIKTTNDGDKREIVGCLERSGAVDIEATFMPSSGTGQFTSCSTKRANWKEWLSEALASYTHVCVDTNILMHHYCSNLLFPMLGDVGFCKMKFMIPRLSILEIERMANEEISPNSTHAQEKLRKKRLAMFATAEIMFLKENKAQLLPLSNKSIIMSFLEIAGNRKVDAWIRQEVFDFASGQGFPQVLFMTNDIVNGLAALSEGFNTCVFSKMGQDKFYIETSFSQALQLAEFILNVAISFEKVTMNVYIDGVNLSDSYEIEGMWTGKAPYHWVNGNVRVQKTK